MNFLCEKFADSKSSLFFLASTDAIFGSGACCAADYSEEKGIMLRTFCFFFSEAVSIKAL